MLWNRCNSDFSSSSAAVSPGCLTSGIVAGRTLPPRDSYEDLPQQENGVGTIRAFLEDLDAATASLPTSIGSPLQSSWVVGRLVDKALEPVNQRLNCIEGVSLNLHGLPVRTGGKIRW